MISICHHRDANVVLDNYNPTRRAKLGEKNPTNNPKKQKFQLLAECVAIGSLMLWWECKLVQPLCFVFL